MSNKSTVSLTPNSGKLMFREAEYFIPQDYVISKTNERVNKRTNPHLIAFWMSPPQSCGREILYGEGESS